MVDSGGETVQYQLSNAVTSHTFHVTGRQDEKGFVEEAKHP